MQALRGKQPIHLNISRQGKLRRMVRERVPLAFSEVQSLMIMPQHATDQQRNSHKHKHTYFPRKHDQKHQKNTASNPEPDTADSGAFRAIHTACPLDSLKGFPLRSASSVRPFRRGIQALSLNSKLELDSLQLDRPTTRLPQDRLGLSLTAPMSPEREPAGLSASIIYTKPELVPRLNQAFEEFYMYREARGESPPRERWSGSPQVAGTKIEPFKKYQIRQIQKGLRMRTGGKSGVGRGA